MPDTTYRILMNGVTGRMGYRQHLLRSILAIRDDGGVPLPDGARLQVEPVLIGRNADKLARLADRARRRRLDHRPRHRAGRGPRLDLLRRPGDQRAQEGDPQGGRSRQARLHREADRRVGRRGPGARRRRRPARHHQRRRPRQALPARADEAEAAGRRRASSAGSSRCAASSATGSSRATTCPRSGPAGTTAPQDGGGMVLDMFCHWNYVLENLFGRVEAVTAKAVTHIPERWDEARREVRRHGRRRGVRHLRARGRRHRPGQLVAGRCAWSARSSWSSRWTAPTAPPSPACSTAASSRASRRPCRCGTPTCPPPRTSAASGSEVPDNQQFGNGFRAQWERFLLDVHHGRPHPYDFAAGVRGLAARRRRADVVGRGPAGGAVSTSDHRHSAPVAGPHGRTAGGETSQLREPREWTQRPRPFRDPGRVRRGARGRRPARRERPGAPGRRRLGVHAGVPRPPVPLRLRRRRGDGHRPAQHGPGLAGRPGAGPPQRRRRPASTAPGSPPAPAPTTSDRAGPRADVREAYAEQVGFVEVTRRPGDPDGVAPARRTGHGRPTTTSACTTTCSPRCASR